MAVDYPVKQLFDIRRIGRINRWFLLEVIGFIDRHVRGVGGVDRHMRGVGGVDRHGHDADVHENEVINRDQSEDVYQRLSYIANYRALPSFVLGLAVVFRSMRRRGGEGVGISLLLLRRTVPH